MMNAQETLSHYKTVEAEAQQQQELIALIQNDASIHKIFQWARHENMDEETMLHKMVVQLAAEKKAAMERLFALAATMPSPDIVIDGVTYSFIGPGAAKVLEINAVLVKALEKIAEPADAHCGCDFPCCCDSESWEAIRAGDMRGIANEALVEAARKS